MSDNREGHVPVTPERRLLYATIAGISNTVLAVGAMAITGVAVGFAGFGSGRGWEPVAFVSLAVWLGGLAAVLAVTRNVFPGRRLPVGSAVAACVVATVVTSAVGWGFWGIRGNLSLPILLGLIAAASAAATWAVSA